ncbi:MAG: lipid-A-disaccharide synthase [Bacteroidaceae bacterium]|nr:lipid-A-disaccharide synthase [Bacteroidales bacterium]MBP3670963.1 lipid-A-disaccharide synthase [Bacteroidaceae bacterium]MBQ2980464.1 lipid-A-disaccharide synthase [Bacteroidaceae bacterium]
MKYYLIAGEASGDLHASHLMAALKREDPHAEFRFYGGDMMTAVGGTCVQHYRTMAYMGFIEVIAHLRPILNNMKNCQCDILDWQPDALILIDYPSFNLKIAKFVKQQLGIPVYYYISPKLWAWKEYRIKDIRRYVDMVYSILPFEVDYYRRHNYKINYVGNPTVDELAVRSHAHETFAQFIQTQHLPDKPIIALLAGSRKAEIRRNLPRMIEAAKVFTNYQLVIAGAPGIAPETYAPYLACGNVRVVYDATYRLLAQSSAAVVTSGTATLEAALLHVPQVVCYAMPGGKLVYELFKRWLKVRYVSLVNLIADSNVVTELLVHQCTAERISDELNYLLYDRDVHERIMRGYSEVEQRLGAPGAPQRAAQDIVALLRK